MDESGKPEKGNKDELFWKILDAAIELDFRKGHLKWSISDLSRTSGITRSLIYYYFGREKMEILLEAVKMLGEEMFGFTAERIDLWEKGLFVESIAASRQIFIKSPHIAAFYLTHRMRENDIGRLLTEFEDRYKQKLKTFFPNSAEPRLEVLWACMFGFVIAPSVSEKAIDGLSPEIIQSIFGRLKTGSV